MMSAIKKIFGPSERINKLVKEVEEQKHAIDKFLKQHNPVTTPYCTIRQSACFSCGLMYWEKDKDHRYVTVNEAHCNIFFNLSYKKANSVIGKTDEELITEIRKHTPHTFGELCISSDEYIKKQYQETHIVKPIRFLEFGYKNDIPLLLDVTKIVTVDKDGNFNGTCGYALDWSSRADEAMELLGALFNKGIAVRIDDGGDQAVACYLIKRELCKKKKKLWFPK